MFSTELIETIAELEELGHEIGLHSNCHTVSLVEGRPEAEVLLEALEELRSHCSTKVIGTAAHGDPLTRLGVPGTERPYYSSSEIYGPDFEGLEAFGLFYDCDQWVRTRAYLCDSGGAWGYGTSWSLYDVVDALRWGRLQELGVHLHVLMHPQWWFGRSFTDKDLEELDWAVFGRCSDGVLPMYECHLRTVMNECAFLRHDVDADLERARKMGRWEFEHGHKATYFFLHTSEYWNSGRPYGTGSLPGPNTEWADEHFPGWRGRTGAWTE